MFMQARKELPSNKKLSPNKRQSQNKGLSCQKELHPAGGLYSIQRKVSIVGLGELRDEQQQEIAADMGAFFAEWADAAAIFAAVYPLYQ